MLDHVIKARKEARSNKTFILSDALDYIENGLTEDMLLFRIGGDEFVLATGRTAPASADQIMDKVISRNGETFEWEGKQIPLSLYAVKFLIPDRTISYGELFTEIHQTLNSVK